MPVDNTLVYQAEPADLVTQKAQHFWEKTTVPAVKELPFSNTDNLGLNVEIARVSVEMGWDLSVILPKIKTKTA